jgi:hypothetical protein
MLPRPRNDAGAGEWIFVMSDGRSRAPARRREGPAVERSKPWPQARALGAFDEREARPDSRAAVMFARPFLFGVALLLACATALLLLSARGGATTQEEAKEAAQQPAQRMPSWLPVVHPTPRFALDSAELVKLAKSYDAVRSATGDGREDRLTFGAAAQTGEPFVALGIYRAGSEAIEPALFFVELSRRAAAAGLAVSKATPGDPLRGKFGEMESAEVRLSTDDGVERSCLAFRRAAPGEGLRLSGWYCPPAGAFPERAELSCLVDRLELSGANDDKVLRDAFAAAQGRRLGCGKPPAPVLTASAAGMAAILEANPLRPHGTKGRRGRKP